MRLADVFAFLREERQRDDHLAGLGPRLRKMGVTPHMARAVILDLRDARRRRDHATVNILGYEADWEVVWCLSDDAFRRDPRRNGKASRRSHGPAQEVDAPGLCVDEIALDRSAIGSSPVGELLQDPCDGAQSHGAPPPCVSNVYGDEALEEETALPSVLGVAP
jgi:hypothetical protein